MSKPKYRASVDANQAEIVRLLREIPGVSVEVIGEPVDLLVSRKGSEQNWLIEVKDGRKKDYEHKYTPKQRQFLDEWPGQVDVCKTLDEVLDVIYG